MKTFDTVKKKKSKKSEREIQILLGLVDLYIATGKTVSSKSLQENGFDAISPATIRNYFVKLEKEGYLQQQHSSGGRAPTTKAYKLYAQHFIEEDLQQGNDLLEPLKNYEGTQIALYLQKAAQLLSDITHTPVFLSSPRFDHDFINDLKVLRLDSQRLMCVMLTDFGLIHTEVLPCPKEISEDDIKDLQIYFNWRITAEEEYINLPPKLIEIGKELYNEVMIRYIVNYSNFTHNDIFSTSFSKLLAYPEFSDAYSLASGLSLFENEDSMRSLLKKCSKFEKITAWIGEDLEAYSDCTNNCCVIAIPYKINHKTVGSIALLGPNRLPYRELFSILRTFSQVISNTLTALTCKFKIAYREPTENTIKIANDPLLVSDKTKS
jgi:heat-inducible transcriptional repressor